jgi:hypothetical protein
MSKFLVRSIAATTVLVGCAGFATAQTTVVFQPDPCVISLAPTYSANPEGSLEVDIPSSAVACPSPVEFSQATFPNFNPSFTPANNGSGPRLSWVENQVYNPASNALESDYVLRLRSDYGGSADPTTYTQVSPGSLEENYYYLVSGGLNYRLVLAAPFTVVKATSAAPACTVNLKSRYSYEWNQEGYFIVPDSVVSCQGFTYNSQDYYLSMSLDSRLINQGSLATTSRIVFNPDTNTFATRYELHLSSYTASGQGVGERREMSVSPRATGSWIFGRFSQSTDGASVVQKNASVGSPARVVYKATLAAPVVIKRATELSVKVRRAGAGKISVSINTDRNASFQNTLAPTYRRQVVLPLTPADHAVVKRGNTVIKRVELSPFGFGRTTIPDVRGVNKYSVTMVTTDDNFAKTVTFKR